MGISSWISNNYIEIFGAVTGIIYVFLEIRQTIWLWPVGIVTSAVYIWVFFTSKIYADMSLQVYYLVISILGWYWWVKGTRVRRSFGEGGVHTSSSEALAKEEGKDQNGERKNGGKGDREDRRVAGDQIKTENRSDPGSGFYPFISSLCIWY